LKVNAYLPKLQIPVITLYPFIRGRARLSEKLFQVLFSCNWVSGFKVPSEFQPSFSYSFIFIFSLTYSSYGVDLRLVLKVGWLNSILGKSFLSPIWVNIVSPLIFSS